MIKNGERALAHIEKIEWIKPIVGADNIEMVGVLGWHCIAKKGEFSVHDLCVYIEIDSKVDEEMAEFAFLAAKGFKVKTMKLGKFSFEGGPCISQGLAMPISSFYPLLEEPSLRELGADVTKELKVTYASREDTIRKSSNGDPEAKYKAMASRHSKIFKNKFVKKIMRYKWGRRILFALFGKKKDKPLKFPTHFSFISKTDEERCENMPWILQNKEPFIVTEKLDGTSCTYILERKGKKFEFYVLSRNIRQMRPDQKCFHDYNIYWELAKKYSIEEKLTAILVSNPILKYVCIQGEGVGTVQGNPLKLKEDDLYIFNLIDSLSGRWDSIHGKEYLGRFGFKWVPILDENFIMPDTMEELKQCSTGPSIINAAVLREGVVYRSKELNPTSFKNVSPTYLLKHNL